MSNTMTLTDLLAAVSQRADMVNSQFVSPAEMTSYINQSYQELYDILVQKFGDDYFVAAPYAVTTDGVTDALTLPTDFQKLLGVDLALDAQTFITLRPFMFSERNQFPSNSFQSSNGITNLRYRIRGNFLWLAPVPPAAQNIRIWYIPQLASLVSGSDIANNLGGWLEYVIVDAAIKCMQKEESDVSVLLMQKQLLTQRIEAAAANRDASNPQTVTDTVNINWLWSSSSSGGGIF